MDSSALTVSASASASATVSEAVVVASACGFSISAMPLKSSASSRFCFWRSAVMTWALAWAKADTITSELSAFGAGAASFFGAAAVSLLILALSTLELSAAHLS